MRVAVVGAGVAGVCTAYELACDGHAVQVFERSGSVATGASFAGTGLLSPGWGWHWSGGRPQATSGTGRQPWRPSWLPRRADDTGQAHEQANAWLRLSMARMDSLVHTSRMDVERTQGALILLRSQRSLQQARSGLAWLAESGQAFRLLSSDEARAVEPALAANAPLRAAIALQSAGVLNCRQFVHGMRALAQAAGVVFRFNAEVESVRGGTLPSLVCQGEQQHFDAVVLCTAQATASLLAPLGIKLALRRAHGLSVTAPVRLHEACDDPGPRSAIIDPELGLCISRLGDRLRVAGAYKLAAADAQGPRQASFDLLYQASETWFPGAAVTSRATQWHSNLVATERDLPVLGPSAAPGVWVHLVEGRRGASLASGLAMALADLIAERQPRLAVAAFAPPR